MAKLLEVPRAYTKKKREPENSSIVATMQRRNPDAKFEICEVCGDWALIWKDDSYSGMHPMGCFDSPKGERVLREKRKEHKETVVTSSPVLF